MHIKSVVSRIINRLGVAAIYWHRRRTNTLTPIPQIMVNRYCVIWDYLTVVSWNRAEIQRRTNYILRFGILGLCDHQRSFLHMFLSGIDPAIQFIDLELEIVDDFQVVAVFRVSMVSLQLPNHLYLAMILSNKSADLAV